MQMLVHVHKSIPLYNNVLSLQSSSDLLVTRNRIRCISEMTDELVRCFQATCVLNRHAGWQTLGTWALIQEIYSQICHGWGNFPKNNYAWRSLFQSDKYRETFSYTPPLRTRCVCMGVIHALHREGKCAVISYVLLSVCMTSASFPPLDWYLHQSPWTDTLNKCPWS